MKDQKDVLNRLVLIREMKRSRHNNYGFKNHQYTSLSRGAFPAHKYKSMVR